MRYLIIVLLCVGFLGCGDSPQQLKPPQYQRGDIVRIYGNDSLGIVTDIRYAKFDQTWCYQLMLSENPDMDREFAESYLTLERRMVWHVPLLDEIETLNTEIKAEIEKM